MKKTILTIVLAMLCPIFNAEAQSTTKPQLKNQAILGKVTSASTSETLPGAVIKITSINQTVLSDDRGAFIINLPNGKYNLSVSYLGHKTRNIEIQVPLKEALLIALDPDDQNLEEVEINAGYYTVKDKERTGSISRITAETISKQPVSNPLAALIGRMAGVDIQQQNGLPGGNFSIQIRGRNSLRGNGNDPLYLIDGVPVLSASQSSSQVNSPFLNGISPLSSVNPADIQSIEILKDADATAIYGSRGANGVVLITTKTGQVGSDKIDLNFSQGAGKVNQKIKLLNTGQYLEMRREAFANDEAIPNIYNAPDLLNWDQKRYTDWQKLLIGETAGYANLQAAFSGGTPETQYLVRGGFYREGNVFPTKDHYQKESGLLNLNHQSVNRKFKAGFSTNYFSDQNNVVSSDFTRQALTLAPNAPERYDSEGNLNWENSSWENPYAAMNKKYRANTDNLIISGDLGYQILEGLQLKSTFGYTQVNFSELSTIPISAQDPANAPAGGLLLSNAKMNSYILEPQLSYTKSFAKGNLAMLFGTTFQRKKQNSEAFSAGGYTSDAMIENIKAAPNISVADASYTVYSYQAIFGRINYNREGKYILNLTGRRDGSSRFGPDKQFANFGALGAVWIFKEEKFLKESRIISTGKLRSSYGITGSDQIADYGFMDTYSASSYPYQGGAGLLPARLFNPNYSWETNTKFEAAVDLGFLNDRFLFSFSTYRNLSENQLIGYNLSEVTGFSSIQSNLPAKIRNTGIELESNTININSRSFRWTSGLSITIPRSKLISYPNLAGSPYSDIYKVGASLNSIKTYKYKGVDPLTGIYTFENIAENASASLTEDGQFLKETGRSLFGGLTNSFSCRGFQLDLFFQFVKQKARNYMSSSFTRPGALSNQPVEVLKRWQNINDNAQIQRFTTRGVAGTAYSMYGDSDEAVVDASFIKLKNIAVSYTLKDSWVKAARIKGCKVYLQGQNLLTISSYLGDPETANLFVLPPLRMLTAGIQVSL